MWFLAFSLIQISSGEGLKVSMLLSRVTRHDVIELITNHTLGAYQRQVNTTVLLQIPWRIDSFNFQRKCSYKYFTVRPFLQIIQSH